MIRFHFVPFTLLLLFGVSAPVRAVEKGNKLPEKLQAILENAEQFELLSLNPDPADVEPKDAFHGWKILGKTAVKDAKTRNKLVTAFKKGVEENKGTAAKCFEPRHGIRVVHEGKTVDFVICFACSQVQVYVGDQEESLLISHSPAATFNDILKEAKVPLADPTKNK